MVLILTFQNEKGTMVNCEDEHSCDFFGKTPD